MRLFFGLEGAILTAMKLYNGDITPINGVDTSLVVFKDFLDRIIELMHGFTLRYKKAFDVCIGHDAILMNQHVAELVDRAISSTYSGRSFNFDEQPTDDIQMLSSDEFIEKTKTDTLTAIIPGIPSAMLKILLKTLWTTSARSLRKSSLI